MTPSNDRNGSVLLEVLCALAIVSVAGFSALQALRAALDTLHDATAAELEVEAAGRVLTALTLLDGHELTQRIGRHSVGEFDVDVERPEPGLFRVAVARRVPAPHELLVTVAYRPDTIRR
jgi:hypothetical protein